MVTPGDQLVFVLRYRNNGAAPASRFRGDQPDPGFGQLRRRRKCRSGSFRRRRHEPGGRSPRSSVRNADGTSRPAAAADVTHVRWRLAQPIPAGGERRTQIQRRRQIGLEPAEQRRRGWEWRCQLDQKTDQNHEQIYALGRGGERARCRGGDGDARLRGRHHRRFHHHQQRHRQLPGRRRRPEQRFRQRTASRSTARSTSPSPRTATRRPRCRPASWPR